MNISQVFYNHFGIRHKYELLLLPTFISRKESVLEYLGLLVKEFDLIITSKAGVCAANAWASSTSRTSTPSGHGCMASLWCMSRSNFLFENEDCW